MSSRNFYTINAHPLVSVYRFPQTLARNKCSFQDTILFALCCLLDQRFPYLRNKMLLQSVLKPEIKKERRNIMRYPTLTLLVLGMLLSSTAPALSHNGGNVEVEVFSDNGKVFHTIPYRDIHRRTTRTIKKYLEALKGENYRIVIRNNTPSRVGVVIAVDGRNIISGKKSHLKHNENMYIINAYGRAQYQGWRTHLDTVHRFYFTHSEDSYAMRTFSDSSAMGVIAVAVFRERAEERSSLFKKGSRQDATAPKAPSVGEAERSGKERAGTGFGHSLYSPVVTVSFKPERNPFRKTLIKYEWRDVLCKKAIIECSFQTGNRLWDEDEFAPYPPGFSNR